MHCAICGYDEECTCLPIPEALKKQYEEQVLRPNLIHSQPSLETYNYSYYPEKGDGLYYVEFDRGGRAFEFTLFKRSYIHSPEEWEKIQKEDGFIKGFMSNEGHPYQLFTGTYVKDGCIPDKKWVMWMVDALNEQVKRS